MEPVYRRNWLIARRNNLVTLGWLTPVITIVFNWLSTLTEDDPVTGALGIGRLAIFQPYTVVIIYLFVNSLVSFLTAAYMTTRELEDKQLSQIRLTLLSPFDLILGHLKTVAVIMIPQMLLFHVAVFIYNLIWLAPGTSEGQTISVWMVFGVFIMNALNTAAITAILCFGLFGRPYLFVALGGLSAFFAVPMNFTLFYIADHFGVGIPLVTAAQILPLAIVILLAVSLGRYRWRSEWR